MSNTTGSADNGVTTDAAEGAFTADSSFATDAAGATVASTEPRDAIVYVPGLRLQPSDERTFQGVAERIVAACDKQAEPRSATFRYEARMVETRVGGFQVATVVRGDGGTERSVVDVYEFPWARTMRKRWESQGSRTRAMQGLVGFLYGVRLAGYLILASFTTSKGPERRRRMGQAAIAMVALVVVAAYLALVIGAALTAAFQLTEDDPTFHLLQRFSLILTGAVAVLFPALRNQVPGIGAALLAASNYIRLPQEPTRIAGELTTLLEELQEQHQYDRVQVVGFSMGAIVAFDCLYPTTGQTRALDGVDRLVTIGPLFELVRATRKNYFDQRSGPEGGRPWVSFWSSADLLSSAEPRTRDGRQLAAPGPQPPTVVQYRLPVELSLLNMVALYGFKSHGLYWGADGELDNNVFDQVIPRLFPSSESDVLAPSNAAGGAGPTPT